MALRIVVALVLSTSLSACAAVRTPVGSATAIRVESIGSDEPGVTCPEFVVTPRFVESYLARSVVITGRIRHDHYDIGPCYGRGTFSSGYETWQWELRAGGTATLTAMSGDVVLLGDPSQESSLSE